MKGKSDSVEWAAVAKEVGYGLKDTQCSCRWKYTLKPLEQGMKQGQEWTSEEVRNETEDIRFDLTFFLCNHFYI